MDIKSPELWSEVERQSAIWTESMGATYAIIPLEVLRPLWNSVAGQVISQKDRLRYEGAVTEALYLKTQNTQLRAEVLNLRKQLAEVTDLGVALPTETKVGKVAS